MEKTIKPCPYDVCYVTTVEDLIKEGEMLFHKFPGKCFNDGEPMFTVLPSHEEQLPACVSIFNGKIVTFYNDPRGIYVNTEEKEVWEKIYGSNHE